MLTLSTAGCNEVSSGYWQVELYPAARPKTAFFHWPGAVAVLDHAAWTLQWPGHLRAADGEGPAPGPSRSLCLLSGRPACTTADFEGALASLWEVFEDICQAGLRLHPGKCQLLHRQTTFLYQYQVGAPMERVGGRFPWLFPSNRPRQLLHLGCHGLLYKVARGLCSSGPECQSAVTTSGYYTTFQESTHCTPAALMFGHELRTLVDLVFTTQAYITLKNKCKCGGTRYGEMPFKAVVIDVIVARQRHPGNSTQGFIF